MPDSEVDDEAISGGCGWFGVHGSGCDQLLARVWRWYLDKSSDGSRCESREGCGEDDDGIPFRRGAFSLSARGGGKAAARDADEWHDLIRRGELPIPSRAFRSCSGDEGFRRR